MFGLNLWHFIVVKPLTWAATHLEGHHVEASTEQSLTALEDPVKVALEGVINAKVADLVTSSDVTLTQVNTLLVPSTDAIVAEAIAKSPVPDAYKAQITAYLVAQVPGVIEAAYNAVIAKSAPAK
jgi:hypothetical protein